MIVVAGGETNSTSVFVRAGADGWPGPIANNFKDPDPSSGLVYKLIGKSKICPRCQHMPIGSVWAWRGDCRSRNTSPPAFARAGGEVVLELDLWKSLRDPDPTCGLVYKLIGNSRICPRRQPLPIGFLWAWRGECRSRNTSQPGFVRAGGEVVLGLDLWKSLTDPDPACGLVYKLLGNSRICPRSQPLPIGFV